MVELGDLFAARARIGAHVLRTPLIHSPGLSDRAGVEMWLKLECRQHTGSFKPRGALNCIAGLAAAERARGVVAASAGNHALGVAHACAVLDVAPARLFVQANASPAKIAKLRRYPVALELVGETYEEAERAARASAEATGAVFVPAYDDEAVVAGQGTVGLELVEDLDEIDAVVVPAGGGALLAGIALAVKSISPPTRIVGVNPEASPSALVSWREGRAVDPYAHQPTLAHGLAGGFGRIPYAVARPLVDDLALVGEEEMKAAIAALIDEEQVLAEASGAAAVAALLGGRVAGARGRVVAVVSGGNIDAATLAAVLGG